MSDLTDLLTGMTTIQTKWHERERDMTDWFVSLNATHDVKNIDGAVSALITHAEITRLGALATAATADVAEIEARVDVAEGDLDAILPSINAFNTKYSEFGVKYSDVIAKYQPTIDAANQASAHAASALVSKNSATASASTSTVNKNKTAADALATAADLAETATNVTTTANNAASSHTNKQAAAASATSANADKNQTQVDRIAVNADKDTIAANLVISTSNKNATAADRIQTDADVSTTEANATLTGSNKDITNANVVTTNANVVKTADDVSQTNLDRIQTGQDRAATTADKGTTAGHVTTTTASKNAAAASAQAALDSETLVEADRAEVAANTATTVLANAEAHDSKVLAGQYANHPEDVKVPGTNTYSALHWNRKTETLAGGVSPDSLKLGGIQAAEYLTEAEAEVGYQQLQDGSIPAPLGAVFSSSATLTGPMEIILPQAWSSTMLSFTLNVYEYGQDEQSFQLYISGYNWSGGSWNNCSAFIVSGDKQLRVRFGYNTSVSKCAIYIGEDNELWRHPAVSVTNFVAGYLNTDISKWKDGWDILVGGRTVNTVTHDVTAHPALTQDGGVLERSVVNSADRATLLDLNLDTSGTAVISGDKYQRAIDIKIRNSFSGGDTGSNEYVVEGIYTRVETATPVSKLRGMTTSVEANNTSGTVNTIYGSSTTAYVDSRDNGNVNQAVGSYTVLAIQPTHEGTIGNVYASRNSASISAQNTTNDTFPVYGSQVDLDFNSGKCGSAYGYSVDMDWNGGTTGTTFMYYGKHSGTEGASNANYGLFLTGPTDLKHYLVGELKVEAPGHEFPLILDRGTTDGPVGIKFQGTTGNSQVGHMRGDYLDTNSNGADYSFQLGSNTGSASVILEDGTIENGGFWEGDKRVYSPNNKPTPADVEADGAVWNAVQKYKRENYHYSTSGQAGIGFGSFSYRQGDQGRKGFHLFGKGNGSDFDACDLYLYNGSKYNRAYHEGFKPTPADVGALAVKDTTNRVYCDAGTYINSTDFSNSPAIEMFQPTAQADAFIGFHVGGDFAFNFGLHGATNKLSVGGGSLGAANVYEIYHGGNETTPDNIGAVSASNGYNIALETTNFGLTAYPMTTKVTPSGGWARAHRFASGADASKFATYGAFGSGDNINYMFMTANTEHETGYNDLDSFRVYPDRAAWGTNTIYHEGNLDPISKTTSRNNTNFNADNVIGKTDIFQPGANAANMPPAIMGRTGGTYGSLMNFNNVDTNQQMYLSHANPGETTLFLRNGTQSSVVDAPWKRVIDSDDYQHALRVASFHIGGSQDLNLYVNTGLYGQQSNVSASTGINYPVSLAGKLEVVKVSDDFIYQTYSTYNDSGVYTRNYYAGGAGWYGWNKTIRDSDVTEASTVSKIVQRDAAGDVRCRLLRSEFGSQGNISGSMAFRMEDGTGDNYLRYCSDKAAIRAFLEVATFKDTYTSTQSLPNGYNSYDVALHSVSSFTTFLPSAPMVNAQVILRKIISALSVVTATQDIIVEANGSVYTEKSHNVSKPCTMTFTYTGTQWLMSVTS